MPTIEIVNLICLVLISAPVYLLAAQLIKRPSWPPWLKAVLAIIVSGLVAIAQSWISGDLGALIDDWGTLTATTVLAYWLVIYASGQVIYASIKGKAALVKLAEWPSS